MFLEAYYTQNNEISDLRNEIDDSVIYAFSRGLIFRYYFNNDWITTDVNVVQDVSNTQEVEYIDRMKISHAYVFEFPIYSFEKKNFYLLQFCNNITLVSEDGNKIKILAENGIKEPVFEETDSKNILICKIELIPENNLAVIAGSLS